MANTDTKVNILMVVVVVLVIACAGMGYALWNINTHMGIMDNKGRALREWAAVTAKWSAHVAKDHLPKIALNGDASWDHIPPPPDPPPDW